MGNYWQPVAELMKALDRFLDNVFQLAVFAHQALPWFFSRPPRMDP
jgi:hypothetical protein